MTKFLHAADLHLDSPFSGLKGLPDYVWQSIRQSTFHALRSLTDAAIQSKVDFVLLAGDIYDLEDRSIKAQAVFREEMERLDEAEIPVYIIHGNHDFLAEEEMHLEMPGNVTVFNSNVETAYLTTKRGERIAVSGFSYDQRWITERKILQYPHRDPSVDWHIGMLHGYAEGNHSEHAHYAPFSIQELQSKEYDYWALGHIHKRQQVSERPLAYYPGCLQGRNKKETEPKGFLMVDLMKTEQTVHFEPVAPIEWVNEEIIIENGRTIEDVYSAIKEIVDRQKENNTSSFLTLTLVDDGGVPENVRRKIQNGELAEAFQTAREHAAFVWVNEVNLKQQTANKMPALKALFPEEWAQALKEVQQDGVFRDVTSDFFQQARQASLLEVRNEFYRENIVEQALEHLYAVMGVDEDED